MPTSDQRPPEQQHSLPRHGDAVDARRRPFVGNESVEDNFSEAAQAAIWTALGPAAGAIVVRATGGTLTVSGSVRHAEDHAAAIRAASAAVHPMTVTDDLVVDASAEATAASPRPLADAASILRVRRFCSLTEASLSAAVRSAAARLEEALAAAGRDLPQHLLVIYRNRGVTTMTIDVAAFVEAKGIPAFPDAEIDAMPAGADVSAPAEPGVEGLLSAQTLLVGEPRDGTEHAVWWQIFPADQFHPWSGFPAAPVHLALDTVKPSSHPATPTA